MEKDIEKLQELTDRYDRIVFFGGAGVSTESGIPDFRSADGLYHPCPSYTSDAADDLLCVGLGGRRIIKKKKK